MSTTQQFYNKARQAIGGLYVWGAQGRVATSAYPKEKAKKYPAYFDGGRLDMMLSLVSCKSHTAGLGLFRTACDCYSSASRSTAT